MPTIKLKLSDEEMRMLDELCDFEDEDRDDTLRMLLKYHHAHMRMVRLEIDQEHAKKTDRTQPDGDDEIPYGTKRYLT